MQEAGEGIPELTAELVVDSDLPKEPVISPDGRWVAYAVGTIGRKEELPLGALWVAAADGSSPPRKLTAGTAWDCMPKWAPDSESLFFGSDRARRGAPPQLHRIRLDGGEAEALPTWPGAISNYLPLADGRSVALVARDEPTEEDRRRKDERDDAVVWGERVPYGRLRLLDLGSGEVRLLDGLGDRHVVEMVQRPDGGPLAVLSWECPDIDPGAFTAELHVVDPETGAVQGLGRAAGPDSHALTWWEHDGGTWHLAYVAQIPPGLASGTAVFDVSVSQGGEHRNLTTGMTVCPEGLAQVADGPPLALFADGLDTAVYRLDPGELRFRRVATREGPIDALTVSRSGEVVAAIAGGTYEPREVHAGPPGGPLVRVSDTRPQVRRMTWGTQERLSYKASDGLELDALLILPVGKRREEGPFPLVTYVHGGPYSRYADELQLYSILSGQLLAAAGYAVFLPNPRGGSGHGHDFASMVAGAIGGDELTDILSGIDLLIADGVADPDRLGIGGWSHGGFMTAWAVGQTDRFKAALMGAGISDWGMLAATGEWGSVEADLTGSVGWEGAGPHPHDRVSPVSYASKVRTPVLIVHGEDDSNVPVGQSIYFHRALSRFGVEHEFVVYPREGHGLRERNHQLDLLRRTRAWFDRWL